MKNRHSLATRTTIALAAAAALGMATGPARALGLGRLSVQSALGEGMRADIEITSLSPDEATSLAVRIASPDTYRAAGVDYNPVLAGTQAVLLRRPDGRPFLRLSSDRAVQEPFVEAILELSWGGSRLVREYTLLFDPPPPTRAPSPAPVPASVAVAPVIAAAPPAAPAPEPAARPATAPAASPRNAPPATALMAKVPQQSPAQTSAQSSAQSRATSPATSPAPVGASADKYAVRPGDSLSQIALRNQRQGVVLDQMLAGLYRANPNAFINANINKLKAGVVLALPTAEAAKALSPSEARQLIVAQSADFGAYRARLAESVPNAPAESPARVAQGKVQATVDDRKPGAAASPDKLRLSGGAVKASGPAATVAAPAAAIDANGDIAARIAELSRSIEELKRQQQSAAQAATVVAVAKPLPAPVVAAAPITAPAPKEAPPAPAPAAMPAPAPAPNPAPSPAPAAQPGPSTQAASANTMPSLSAPAPSASAPRSAAASAPLPAPPAPVGAEPGLLDSLSDNPMLLPGAGILAVVLGGFAAWRLRGRFRRPASETSFLESRMQPDSFFGASGGQRVDTRDSSTQAASSIGYSLSQLDAIGDVDPVAEADVYLAYGRDLQAEEILKEAMRSSPDRMAVRTKLLEVYAKRRDTKAFELLATQLYSLSHGTGQDWDKTQELGRQLDPDNEMYQPGGRPAEVVVHDRVVEPLGATTLPQSDFPPSGHAKTQPAMMPKVDSMFDLDLDLDQPETSHAVTAPMPLASMPLRQAPEPTTMMDLDLPPMRPSVPRLPEVTQRLVMDDGPNSILNALDPTEVSPLAHRDDNSIDFGDFSLSTAGGGLSEPGLLADSVPTTPNDLGDLSAEESDPLARKFDLAEEFRQIGDLEGARDLLEEVAAKASGALKAKAQAMLQTLA